MAGRNQHNIPRFLQRSFGVTSEAKPKLIWQYKKRLEPKLVKIEDTGAALDFYSTPTESLDTQITAVEKLVFKHYAGISQAKIGEEVDPNKAASVISHLAPRSAHIRDMLQTGVTTGLGMMRRIADPSYLYRYLGLDAGVVNDAFVKRVVPTLEEAGIFNNPLPRDIIIEMAFAKIKESPGEILTALAATLTASLEAMEIKTPVVARDGHNRAIGIMLNQNVRYDELRAFNWRILSPDVDSFILPDCIALGYDENGRAEPYVARGLGATQVVMPLSRKRLLVGTKSGAPVQHADNFNVEAARNSHTFFLASSKTASFEELSSDIGRYYDEKFEDVLSDVLSEYALSPKIVQAPKSPHSLPKFRAVGRNDSCPCGSGIKYKKCCMP